MWYYRRWEEGFDGLSLWPAPGTGRMGGDGGFRVDPLADPAWDWFVLDHLRWRGHDVSICYLRGDGLSVSADGRRLQPRSGVFRAASRA